MARKDQTFKYPPLGSQGPFRVDQLPVPTDYELSHGHAILKEPQGGRGSRKNLHGAEVLDTDPAVEEAGIDTGYVTSGNTMRAPDVAVGNVPDAPGWVPGAPALAVEYADTGQDEGQLRRKIRDLFDAGTRVIWVVRLIGPRRVEVHEPGRPMRTVEDGGELAAPGILQNAVPVRALYDRAAAHELMLRNLLQRRGYESVDAIRAEGQASAILQVLAARGIAVDEPVRARISACRDRSTLDRWLARAAVCASAAEVVSSDVPAAV